MIKIAVDAMGGDSAPEAIVSGSIDAARLGKGQYEVVLVGDQQQIEAEIGKHHFTKGLPISIAHASQKIEMDESPSQALRKKPDASIAVAVGLHAKGKVDAVVSAGNTGAVLGAALFALKRIEGVQRPALGSFLPHESGVCFIVDVGANVDCKPEQLAQFGLMGSIFYNLIMEQETPNVGLVNIGEEPKKGNEVAVAAHEILSNYPVHFIGNVEGRDILHGKADVVVCDGFVGNVILKFGEGLTRMLRLRLKQKIGSNIAGILGHWLIRPKFYNMLKLFDYQEYGGAPLLGVRGHCIVAHGRSTPRAIRTAVHEAWHMAHTNVARRIEQEIKAIQGEK